MQGLSSDLPTLSDNINPTRDWRESVVLWDGDLVELSDDDLVMYLELDEERKKTAADSSLEGKNNQGKLKKGAKFSDGAVKLDGKNDFIEVKDSNDINTSTHAKRTISVWFKVDDKDHSIANRLSTRKEATKKMMVDSISTSKMVGFILAVGIAVEVIGRGLICPVTI